jgi:hypothetical protein
MAVFLLLLYNLKTMKNTHISRKNGLTTGATITIVVAIIIVIGALIYAFNPRQAETPIDPNLNQNSTSTDPIGSNGTSTSQATTTPENPNLKMYANPSLGFSFTYPKDFSVKLDAFSQTNGVWTATLQGARGDILVRVQKAPIVSNDIKLESTTGKIGTKQASIYNTRRDVCDATVAQTGLDGEYALQFVFQKCGSEGGSIFKDKDDIQATLASVKFSNANSQLYVNEKLGFAFRYPTTFAKPTSSTASNVTTLKFGNDLELVSGPQYNSALKRNLTYKEVVTGALTTPNTTVQEISMGGKTASLLTTTPASGAKTRTVYVSNKNTTDLIIIKQTGVDAEGLDLIVASFGFNFVK